MKTTTEFELIAIDRLVPYANNARTHSPEQIAKLRSSIREFGFINPVIVDRELNIIAGHGRVIAARAEGIRMVPCVYADHLTEAQKKAYILADNRMALDAGWDEELLKIELEALQAEDFDLSLTGFDGDELNKLFNEEEEAEDDGFDPEEAMPEEPISKRGDVWILGNHRLMCGDSTSEEDVARLMAGEKADLIMTDPPYNVAYQGSNGLSIQNDDMPEAEFRKFLTEAFSRMRENSKPGAAFYVWHAETEGAAFRLSADESLGKVRQTLIWVKNQFVLGRQDYQWKHEPCLYGWTDGAAHYFVDDRSQSTVFEDRVADISKMKKDEMRELLRKLLSGSVSTTVIGENKPVRNAEHPTMKPVRLIGGLVKNSSRPGELVLDLFGGSGTTMIACEQLGRRSNMMELDPKYCDVIVKRWESLTGRKAELSDD